MRKMPGVTKTMTETRTDNIKKDIMRNMVSLDQDLKRLENKQLRLQKFREKFPALADFLTVNPTPSFGVDKDGEQMIYNFTLPMCVVMKYCEQKKEK